MPAADSQPVSGDGPADATPTKPAASNTPTNATCSTAIARPVIRATRIERGPRRCRRHRPFDSPEQSRDRQDRETSDKTANRCTDQAFLRSPEPECSSNDKPGHETCRRPRETSQVGRPRLTDRDGPAAGRQRDQHQGRHGRRVLPAQCEKGGNNRESEHKSRREPARLPARPVADSARRSRPWPAP